MMQEPNHLLSDEPMLYQNMFHDASKPLTFDDDFQIDSLQPSLDHFGAGKYFDLNQNSEELQSPPLINLKKCNSHSSFKLA